MKKKNNRRELPPNIWNEPYITPTKEDLQRRFKEYNEQYFDNVLPKCRVSLRVNKDYYGLYVTTSKNKGLIFIARYAYWTDTLLKLVLIHEMCHHYVHMIYKPKHFVLPHGRLFNKVCKMLKKKHGIRVKSSEIPHLYFYKEIIPVTFWQKLRQKYWGSRFYK